MASSSEDSSSFSGASSSTPGPSVSAAEQCKLLKAVQEPLYLPLRPHSDWGDPQVVEHSAYAQLFFDLIFVGFALKVGLILNDGVVNGNFVPSAALAVAMYTAGESMWSTRNHFEGRFAYDDKAHRIWSFISGSIAAMVALSMASTEVMADSSKPNTITFSAGLVAYYVWELIPYLELSFSPSQRKNVVLMARANSRRAISTLTILVAALVTSCLGLPLVISASLWFAYPLVIRIWLFYIISMKYFTRSNSVPVQVHYTINRSNEFVLLMLGEGILSIIIESLEDNADFYFTFFFSFSLLSLLALLHYSATPMNENWHALRRSSTRAIIWDVLQRILGFGLIAVAAGFRLILSTLVADEPVPRAFAYLLCAPTTVVVLVIFAARVTHHGLSEEWFLLDGHKRAVKVAFWTVKLLCALVILAGPHMDAPAWGLLLFVSTCTFLACVFQLIDQRVFIEHHETLITKEILERQLRYAKEKGQTHRIKEIKRELGIAEEEEVQEAVVES